MSDLSRFLLILALIPCLAGAADARNITIATDATFPPFHYVDDAGIVTGFDVELARAALQRAGYDAPQVVVTAYDELFDGLLSDRHHVVAATTGITPERQARYLFSEPYFETCQAVLVRRAPGEPEQLTDLAGRKVGAAGAMTSAMALEHLSGTVPVILTKQDVTEDMIRDDGRVPVLENGTIDALVVDEFEAVEAARASQGRLRVLSQPLAREQYAFVLAPGDVALKQALDEALQGLRADGTLRRFELEYGVDRDASWPIELDP
jgi:ABC-type amino acid transport substrate-binding protein